MSLHYQDTKERLGKISKTMCLAKWYQTTVHFGIGQIHSCHHCPTVSISSHNGIEIFNPAAIKSQRKNLLEGVRDSACNYCWRVEREGATLSDRVIKSTDFWAKPKLDQKEFYNIKENFYPAHLEISFSNKCNLQCIYCQPEVSSSLWKDALKNGTYVGRPSLLATKMRKGVPLKENQNHLIDGFFSDLENILSNVKVLRVTGGEPLLTKSWTRLMKNLKEMKNLDIEIHLNTNLMLPRSIIKTLIEDINNLLEKNIIKGFQLFTSVDSFGKDAEYIRYGLNYDIFLSKFEYFINETKTEKISIIMVTLNFLSLMNFKRLLADILNLNQRFSKKMVMLDISYLNDPDYLSIMIAPDSYGNSFEESIDFLRENSIENIGPLGFSVEEIEKMERTYKLFLNRKNIICATELEHRRYKFSSFVKEYQKRSGRELIAHFPDLKDVVKKWGRPTLRTIYYVQLSRLINKFLNLVFKIRFS